MKTLSFLFYILLQGIFLAPATGIVYYVKPTSPNTTNCTGLPCYTLQYYFENVNKTINNQKNVTMIFMSGTHATSINVSITAPVINMTGESQGVVLNSSSSNDVKILQFNSFTEISLSNIEIIGSNWNFRIQKVNTPITSRFTMSSIKLNGLDSSICLFTDANIRFNSCEFYGVLWETLPNMGMNVTMEDCILNSSYLQYGDVDASGVSQVKGTNQSLAMNTNVPISQASYMHAHISIRFDSCRFYDCRDRPWTTIPGANVTMENCKLIRTRLSILYGNVVFSGVSEFTGARQTAISSYFSNITLSGVVVFANNSGIRGGAMALYSSTLNVAPGANVSFFNNSAEETGGAIFINPSLIPDQLLFVFDQTDFLVMAPEGLLPQCFYHLLNCSEGASYVFSFANNSAMHGGDDIYGASLDYHQSSGNCNLTVNIKNTGLSPVSSDPTRVCLCDECQQINLKDDSDSQCAFNRAGRLCGKCKDNYSLAIGSSHCISCPNNNNLALLIFFAAAGLLLVFFISAFNLTVTQGMINGLVFYANIVWIYQSLFFPEEQKLNPFLVFLKMFIAWINLDFGIETCLVNGLTAFWKTWLQFVFPLYIWAIAGVIIVAARYSTKLTNLLGNRAIPVLNTLLLLSYMKLLRIVATALEFSTITKYPEGSTLVVWSKDGNLSYFGFPHVLLFLAGLGTLLFLWLPYTVLLFSIQWLRRLPSFVLLKWIMRFHPVYDAYFAPLKLKHQYWFGVLLLARGILLLIFASTFTVPQSINLLLLLIFGILLLFYMVLKRPYKNKSVLLLQSSFLINLTILSGLAIFARTQHNEADLQTIAVGLSIGVAFLQFCGVVLHAVFAPRCSCKRQLPECEFEANNAELVPSVAGYRDSILNETQPLITDDSYKQLE